MSYVDRKTVVAFCPTAQIYLVFEPEGGKGMDDVMLNLYLMI